jgi:hypothetical protein
LALTQQPGKTMTMKAQTPTTSTTPKPTIKRGSKPYLYHVESKTRAGLFHVVDVHRLTCNCEAGRYQRGCWHMRISLAYHDWRKRQQARAGGMSPRVSGMAALQEAVA